MVLTGKYMRNLTELTYQVTEDAYNASGFSKSKGMEDTEQD